MNRFFNGQGDKNVKLKLVETNCFRETVMYH